jgi:hypothetical protein
VYDANKIEVDGTLIAFRKRAPVYRWLWCYRNQVATLLLETRRDWRSLASLINGDAPGIRATGEGARGAWARVLADSEAGRWRSLAVDDAQLAELRGLETPRTGPRPPRKPRARKAPWDTAASSMPFLLTGRSRYRMVPGEDVTRRADEEDEFPSVRLKD